MKFGFGREDILRNIVYKFHLSALYIFGDYFVKIRVVTSPKSLSQTGVLGKTCIYEARHIQIE